MPYLTSNTALMKDFIATIHVDLAGLESWMRITEVLISWLMNDKRNKNMLLDTFVMEELSENICNVEYIFDVMKPKTRRQNEHLIDYMLILANYFC